MQNPSNKGRSTPYPGSSQPEGPTQWGDLEAQFEALEDVHLERSAALRRSTTLRIGGPAELLLDVGTEASLVASIRRIGAAGAPVHLLGLGSNVLIPDQGLEGVVIRLIGDFKNYEVVENDLRVVAGAAMPLALLANRLTKQGFLGLEGVVRFSVFSRRCRLYECWLLRNGKSRTYLRLPESYGPTAKWTSSLWPNLDAEYRRTSLHGSGAIVTQATFQLKSGDGVAALARIKELNTKRWASLPSGKPTAGSIFRNPEGDHAGRVIEESGLKGKQIGGAKISQKHANVIVNQDNASAEDVFELMSCAYLEVKQRFGLLLEPEVVLAGDLGRRWWTEVVGSSWPT